MPISSTVVAGNPALASQYNNLRIDALATIDSVIAGEAIAATTTVSSVTLPTLVYQNSSNGKWYNASASTAAPGWAQAVGMAYEAAAGDGSTFRIYLPGSLVTGSGMTAGTAMFPSSTSGGIAAFSTTTTLYYKWIGTCLSSTSFHFCPTSNTTLIESNQIYLTAGEAILLNALCYIKQSDGLVYNADADTLESGNAIAYCVCQYATSASGQTSRFKTIGGKATMLGTFAAGNIVYPSSTAGEVSTTRLRGGRMIGIAISSSVVYLFPGQPNTPELIFNTVAGENWSKGDLLYFKKSDSRYYKADADVAESGICEFPAIAYATHTGGAGSEQIAYFPGSIVPFGTVTVTAGNRLYPSATAGAYQANTPASYDTFYRVIGQGNRTDTVNFQLQEMQFLPTGIQEKGFASGGTLANNTVTTAASEFYFGVQFRKTMVNTPSSITVTSVASVNLTIDPPTTIDITRFGFNLAAVRVSGNGLYRFSGTYLTVGN